MPKLFDGTIVTEIPSDYYIAAGKPNEAGSINQAVADFLSQVAGVSPTKGTFQNTDLNSGDNYSLIIAHTNNTLYVDAVLFDSYGVKQSVDGIFSIIDSSNVKFTMNASIDGTWRYILIFY